MQDRLIWSSLQRWDRSTWRHVVGKKNPTVGIVNIGAEEEKGKCPCERDISASKRMSWILILSAAWKREISRTELWM